MDWGILQGLGQGLTQVGSDISANAKDAKLAKLREAETVRREERERARRQAIVEKTTIESDGEGAMWKHNWNNEGQKVGESVLASPEDIRKIRDEELKSKLTLDNLRRDETLDSQTILLNEKKLADYDADHDLERRVKEANIEQSGLQGRAAVMRAENVGSSSRASAAEDNSPVTVTQGAQKLLSENAQTLNKDFAKSKDNPEGLSQTEMLKLAKAAIELAAKTGADPRQTYADGLEGYAARRKKTKSWYDEEGAFDQKAYNASKKE